MKIEKTITINAPAQKIFTAITNSQLILQYRPLQRVESDWVQGSSLLYSGEKNGQAFTEIGEILAFQPPHKFSYSYWSFDHRNGQVPQNRLVITYELEATLGQQTTVRLTHDKIQSDSVYRMIKACALDELLIGLKEFTENNSFPTTNRNQIMEQ